MKPASDTPATGGLLLAKIFETAGQPPGVLSVIVGSGREIGNAFVTRAARDLLHRVYGVGRTIGELAAKATNAVQSKDAATKSQRIG